jgi:hypothetical protein
MVQITPVNTNVVLQPRLGAAIETPAARCGVCESTRRGISTYTSFSAKLSIELPLPSGKHRI